MVQNWRVFNIDMMSQVEYSTPKLWWHITAKTQKHQNYSTQLLSAYFYMLNSNIKEIYIQISLPDIYKKHFKIWWKPNIGNTSGPKIFRQEYSTCDKCDK